jgi:TonB family protein
MQTRIVLLALLMFFPASRPAKGEEKAPAFEPPRVISTVEAAYPATTIQGGTVALDVTVAPTGAIANIRVIQEARGFTQEAIEAVKKWKFAAATFEGKPLATSIPVAFSFSQPIVWGTRQKP